MEVILREHVDNLGRRGDVVKVAAGYARNYLLPRKLALRGDRRQQAQIERERRSPRRARREERTAAEASASGWRSVEIAIARRVGENEALYGSVTSARHRRGARRQGLRDRSAQDPAARADQGARRVHGAGEAAPRRHRAGQGEGRRRAAQVRRVSQRVDRGGTSDPVRRVRPFLFPATPHRPMAESPRRTHASAQPRSREVGARRDPASATTRSTTPRSSSTRSDFFRDAHRRIFEQMVALSERGDADRLRHAERGAGAVGRARRSRRPRLHRGARRRRAALGQRRVLRADRQGEVDAPEPDSFGEQDPRRRVRGGGGAGPASSTRPSARSSRSPRIGSATGFVPLRDLVAEQLRRRSRSCSSTRGWSPACRPASPISTR